jgi:hypothetical protein
MYSTVECNTVQYSTVQYSTVQYCTVQYSIVQYSTVQYGYLPSSIEDDLLVCVSVDVAEVDYIKVF